jgi:hypothetical protein
MKSTRLINLLGTLAIVPSFAVTYVVQSQVQPSAGHEVLCRHVAAIHDNRYRADDGVLLKAEVDRNMNTAQGRPIQIDYFQVLGTATLIGWPRDVRTRTEPGI